MKNLFDIRGRVVVVTGGAGILGRSICEYLAEQGAKVVVLDRDEQSGEALAASIREKGGEALFLVTDVLNREVLVANREAILALIASEKNPDRREQAIRQRFPKDYAYIRSMIYPQLRAVNFRYNLRRKGMIKDTIHTTELDTAYARGVEMLQKRKYAKALYILNDYNDRNTVVAHLSLDHNERALELLVSMPKDAVAEYLKAIACSRLGRKEEGREHFLEACRLDERMEYRGNLDPEIAELLKQ